MWLIPVLVLAAVLLAVAVLAGLSGLAASDIAGLLLASSVCWLVWAFLYLLPGLRRGE